jgi:hypothetical protein
MRELLVVPRVVSSLFIFVMLGVKWVHVFVLMPQLIYGPCIWCTWTWLRDFVSYNFKMPWHLASGGG